VRTAALEAEGKFEQLHQERALLAARSEGELRYQDLLDDLEASKMLMEAVYESMRCDGALNSLVGGVTEQLSDENGAAPRE
jgi:hypothetical protein